MTLWRAEQVDEAAAALRGGGLIGMPTETVYGLAVDAMNLAGVARVFEVKGRPRFDPLIVHAATPGSALQWATAVPEEAKRLAEAFWPGPMTLVLPKVGAIDGLITAGLPTVALRVPGHALARRLIDLAGSPIAAPSANRFGRISPTCAAHVVSEFDGTIPVLDGGPCERGVESTVVAFEDDGAVCVLRLGSLSVEAIEEVVGRSVVVSDSTDRPGKKGSRLPEEARGLQRSGLRGPGMLTRHYAPRTPLVLVERWGEGGAGVGALAFKQTPIGYARVEQLSAEGDLVAAAAGLFAAMRRLDEAGLSRIEAQRVPDEGLGRAINDRLVRAAAAGGGG